MASGPVEILRASDATTKQEARSTAYIDSRLTSKSSTADKDFTIPIIDISSSFKNDRAAKQDVARQIHDACTSSGFFYLTGHGVPESVRQNILNEAQRFFAHLTAEQKEALHIKKSKYGYGWEPREYTSIAGDKETKEGFNFGYEEGLDPSGGDGKYRNLDGSEGKANLWPEEEQLPGFYAVVREYYGHVLELARHLFRLFALSLDLPADHFDPMTTHPGGIARLLYYPPPKNPLPAEADEKEEQIGLGAHSDYECFTLLLSDTHPGLEILTPSGHWHRASLVPGSFIVNIADFLMRWTNDKYKSTVHRVVNRGTEARYSVPFFFSVNYDVVVETLPTCLIDEEKGGERKYPPIRAGEYILERLNATTKDGEGFFGAEAVFGNENKD